MAASAVRTVVPNLADPALYEAGVPYAAFAHLRREEPIHWTDRPNGGGFWSVMRHADIVEVSRQPDLFASGTEWGGHRIFDENSEGLIGAGDSGLGTPFISRDPPIHTRYRKIAMPALAPGRLRPGKW